MVGSILDAIKGSVVETLISGFAIRLGFGMMAGGGAIDYRSSFVDVSQGDVGVEVSTYALDALDEVEAKNPTREINISDIQLFDATDSYEDVGVFPTRPIESITTLYWHHTASDTLTPWSVIAAVAKKRGLGGMPYHLGITRSGRIEILQPLELRTNHTAGRNSKGASSVFLGNYDLYPLNEAQEEAAEKVRRLMSYYGIEEEYMHREVRPTICPGKYAAAYLLGSK